MRHAAQTLIALLLVARAGVATAADAPPRPADRAEARLHALFDAEWERGLREDPLQATYLGDHRYDDRWPDVSAAALAKQPRRRPSPCSRRSRSIPAAQLSSEDQLNQRTVPAALPGLGRRLRLGPAVPADHAARAACRRSHELAELIQFASTKDYENWIARLEGLGAYVDQTIALMREGMRRGLVQPKVIMQRVPDQIAKQIVADPDREPVLRAVPRDAGDDPAGRAGAAAAPSRGLRSSGRSCRRSAGCRSSSTKEYLPACRESVGVWDMPGGEAWYQNRVALVHDDRTSPPTRSTRSA